jgi:hypothetical protein
VGRDGGASAAGLITHLPNQIELSAFDCLDGFEAGEEFARLVEPGADERGLGNAKASGTQR